MKGRNKTSIQISGRKKKRREEREQRRNEGQVDALKIQEQNCKLDGWMDDEYKKGRKEGHLHP